MALSAVAFAQSDAPKTSAPSADCATDFGVSPAPTDSQKSFTQLKTVHEAVEDDVGDGGSPICSCQRASGNWEVRRVERVW